MSDGFFDVLCCAVCGGFGVVYLGFGRLESVWRDGFREFGGGNMCLSGGE